MPPPDDRTAALPDAAAAADPTASAGHTGPAPAAPADVPERLGKYRVTGVLGRGGMGVVYRAEDPVLRRQVALKVMPPAAAADPAARDRFLREARAQAAVEHDHVVPIYDVVDDAAVPFLAMPVLRGTTLADALRANPRPPLAEAVRIAREAADGLAAAHATGLVHRDVKPGNIWLEEGRLRVKVLDFGLARAAADAGESPTAIQSAVADAHLTRTGSIVGTPAYMSPEQASGRPLDHRTDLFSLGVVLYQMVAGRPPFPGRTAAEVMAAVVRVEPVPVGELVPDLPPPLADLITRLLAKDPAGRPPSAAAVAADLRAVELTLTGVSLPAAEPWGDLADDAPTLTQSLAPARRRPTPWWVPAALVAAGLLVVAAGVGAVVYVRVATDAGELVIDDGGAEDVALTVRKDGVPVAERTLERKLRLPSGKYTVELTDPDPAVKLSAAMLTLDRGGRESLTLRRSQAVAVARKLGDEYRPDDPEWLKLFLKQPPRSQVARFTKELQRLNPDFDGKVEFKDDGGKVVEVSLTTDAVTDLSPIRALREVKVLSAQGSGSGRGRHTDLAPLRGLRLTHLYLAHNNAPYRNTDALRGMPLLDLVNLSLSRPGEVEVFRGISLHYLVWSCPEPIDLAVLKSCLAERAIVQGSVTNLAGLGSYPLGQLQTTPDVFDDPAAAKVRIESIGSYPPEILAVRGRHLRQNPHVKQIQLSPPAVFWSFYDLTPRPLAPTWWALGPCRPSDEDPIVPTKDGGRLPREFFATPIPRGNGPLLLWKEVAPDVQGRLDFGAVTGRDESAVAWLHTVVSADEAGRAVLYVGGAPHYRVWVNGEVVLSKPENGWSTARQAVLVSLRAGENAVAVRAGLSPTVDATPLAFHLHRLRPGEAAPAGIDPPPPPAKE